MAMLKRFTVLVALTLTLGLTAASVVPSETDGLLTTALHFVKECGDKSMFLCMKVSASRWLRLCDKCSV